LDWRDKDRRPEPGGAEDAHYERLRFPYASRNSDLATLHELRLIRGIDKRTFYGEDANLNGLLDDHENDGDESHPPDDGNGELELGLAGLTTTYSYELNRRGDGQERVNLNEADESQLGKELNLSQGLAKGVVSRRSNPRFRSVFDLLEVKPENTSKKDAASEKDKVTSFTLKWIAENLDNMTLDKEQRLKGRINVNTASRPVLLTLPKMNEQTVAAIVAYRASDAGPVRRIGDLFISNTLNEEQFKAIAQKLTVRSNVFEVTSRGYRVGGVEQTIVAVIDRGSQPAKILYWYQSE